MTIGSIPRAAPRSGEVLASRAAEQALLGCVLIDEWEVWGELEECPVAADDFFYPENQALWRAFRWLYTEGMEVTAISTVHALDRLRLLDATDKWLGAPMSGVEVYLVELMATAFSAKGCSAFARIVVHYADMRGAPNTRSRREIDL